MSSRSLYERIGGKVTIEKAVHELYERVLNDKKLAPFFEGTIKECVGAQQVDFLTHAFGGKTENEWKGKTLRSAHRQADQEGLSDEHFKLFLDHLLASFKNAGVHHSELQQISSTLDSYENEILGK